MPLKATTILFLVCFVHIISAENSTEISTETSKSLLPNPLELIVNLVKWQIKKLTDLVQNLINAQINILKNIGETASKLANKAIETAIVAIDVILDGTVGKLREIFQDSIDKGINITECFIFNMDRLKILRRQLILDEVQCVTNQVGELYEIIDGAVANFTGDVETIIELPERLQKCLLTIKPITCVTKIVYDVTDLQKAIPNQVLGIMVEILNYFNGFDQRVHGCQFEQLRKAIDGGRGLVDNLVECVKHPQD